MLFSKKILFGTLIGLSTTAIVVGTAVGVTVSQNSVDNSETELNNSDSTGIQNKPNSSSNSDPISTSVTIDLKKLAEQIKENNIVVKAKNHLEEDNSSMTIETANIYAFNVEASNLALNGLKFPESVTTEFNLTSEQNTVSNMNKGMLDVEVTLKDNQAIPKQHKTTIKLTKFKKVNVEKDFANLFEDNENFVLKIEPAEQSSQQQYTDLAALNNQSVMIQVAPAASSGSSRQVREAREAATDVVQPVNQQTTTTGLTVWLNKDENKKSHTTGITLQGQAKLAKISEQDSKAYFHLVSKDANNKLKLVKKDTSSNTNLEVAIAEIKTINLLASDVSVVPTNINTQHQKEFIDALKNAGINPEEIAKKYSTDNADISLNRDISVNLGEMQSPNQLFIKPYAVLRPMINGVQEAEEAQEMVNLPLSAVVSFGEKDYVTSFRTSEKAEAEQLKSAGFNFGLYTKKLTSEEQVVDAKVITDMKQSLITVFTSEKYTKPMNKPTNMPMGFTHKEISKDMLENGFAIQLMKTEQENQKTENWLAFASYSYSGISMNNVLLTPSISLIRVESNSIVH